MTSKHPLKETFAYEATYIMTVDEISRMLEMPSSFPVLLRAYGTQELRTKSAHDSEQSRSEEEILKFVPEGPVKLEDGRELGCKDFWLQIHIKGNRYNPVTGVKFMDLGEGRYEVAQAYLTSIMEAPELAQDLCYRPTLGSHIIEQVDALAHNVLGKPLKLEPSF